MPVLIYMPTGERDSMQAAEVAAREHFTGHPVEWRNPDRIGKEGLEVNDVTGVILCGRHPALQNEYERAGICVHAIPLVRHAVRTDAGGGQYAYAVMPEDGPALLARDMCNVVRSDLLVALIGTIEDVTVIEALAVQEARNSAREIILTALTTRKGELLNA